MSVIFDALQQDKRLGDKIKQPAIAESIVLDEKIRTRKVLFVLILMGVLVTLWLMYSNLLDAESQLEVSAAKTFEPNSSLEKGHATKLIAVGAEPLVSETTVIPTKSKPSIQIEPPEKVLVTRSFSSASAQTSVSLKTKPIEASSSVVLLKSVKEIEVTESAPEPTRLDNPINQKVEQANQNIVKSNSRFPSNSPHNEVASKKAAIDISFLVTQIKSAIHMSDFQRAEELLIQLEQHTSDGNILLLKLRGYALLTQQHNKQARDVYQSLLRQDPDNLEANLNMSLLEIRLGKSDQALVRLNRLQSLYPDSSEVAKYLEVVRRSS